MHHFTLLGDKRLTVRQADRSVEEWMVQRYPPSWIDQLYQQLEALPGPCWLLYLLLAVVLVLAHAAIKWIDGSYPVATFPLFHIVVISSVVWFTALPHYLNGAAKRAMARFRPALASSQREADELEYCLTTLPARPTRWVTLVGLLYGLLVVISVSNGSVFAPSALAFTSPAAIGFEAIIGLLIGLSFWLFIYHTIHQVRMVNRIYAAKLRLDLFDLTPIHAFSGLTAQTAAGGLALVSAWVATEPGITSDQVSLAAVMATVVLALITFIWPLLGIHRLLVKEKNRAKGEAGQRLRSTIAELHLRIDNEFSADVEVPIQAMAGLQQELDLLNEIPTWPWQPATIRGLATAILVPVVLWFITYFLERWLSF